MDQDKLITANNVSEIQIWLKEKNQNLAILKGHEANIIELKYDNLQRTIVSSSKD